MILAFWPRRDDGPPCAPRDIASRIEALYEPHARWYVRWQWIRTKNEIILTRAGIVSDKGVLARRAEKG